MKLLVRERHRTGQEQHGGVRSEEEKEQQNHQGYDALCPLSPHCEKFEMKYQSLTESKRCEYRFLYSAQAHCVVCLEFHSAVPGFNFQCKSMCKTARGCATTATGRRRIQAAQIPAEIETWLVAHDL